MHVGTGDDSCFCLMAQIEVQWVQIRPIRLIRLIRGRKRIHRTGRFILVYRLAIDAEPRKGDGVGRLKISKLA